MAVCNTIPATTPLSCASKVRFTLFVVLPSPGSVTGKRRLLIYPFYSAREFGVEKMRSRGAFCYVCIAGQRLVNCYTWAAKTIVVFKFRDFGSEESSDFWLGFLHLNLLILRVLHSYIEDKGFTGFMVLKKLNSLWGRDGIPHALSRTQTTSVTYLSTAEFCSTLVCVQRLASVPSCYMQIFHSCTASPIRAKPVSLCQIRNV